LSVSVDPFHEAVARIALRVADRYGFVLGGGPAAGFLADRDAGTLLEMARRVDPALEDEDVSRAGRRLDRAPDAAFARYGLGPAEVARVRARFADWPR
jgi:hypothetical protein